MDWLIEGLSLIVALILIDLGLKYFVKVEKSKHIFADMRRSIAIVCGVIILNFITYLLKISIEEKLLRYTVQIMACVLIISSIFYIDSIGKNSRKR
jgi:uncharacterized membrane protein